MKLIPGKLYQILTEHHFALKTNIFHYIDGIYVKYIEILSGEKVVVMYVAPECFNANYAKVLYKDKLIGVRFNLLVEINNV